jgi:hypothetical protein
VALRNGEASATGRVNGGLSDDGSRAKRPRRSSRENPTSQTFAVTDGRIAVGTIEVAKGMFTSISIEGEIIGEFATLKEASRAFDKGRA